MQSDKDEKIRHRAYLLWEREGQPEGRELEHWAQAAGEIEGESAALSDPVAPKVTTADDPTRSQASTSPAQTRGAEPGPAADAARSASPAQSASSAVKPPQSEASKSGSSSRPTASSGSEQAAERAVSSAASRP